jgi:hypothetical protein
MLGGILEPSGMKRHVDLEQTDVSEVRTASIIKAIMEAVCTSQTSVYSNETTRRYFPEGSNIYVRRCGNLKSFLLGYFNSYEIC